MDKHGEIYERRRAANPLRVVAAAANNVSSNHCLASRFMTCSGLTGPTNWHQRLPIVVLLATMLFISPTDAQLPEGSFVDPAHSCRPIRSQICQEHGMPYNLTMFPNLMNNERLDDAEHQLATFKPLIQYGCSRFLRFFLCSVYMPLCAPIYAKPIGPCRPLCEHVKTRCEPVLVRFGFPWPKDLECDSPKFPISNDRHEMCMMGNFRPNITTEPPRTVEKPSAGPLGNAPRGDQANLRSSTSSRPSIVNNNEPGYNIHMGHCAHLRRGHEYVYLNRTQRCALRCDSNALFNDEQKQFVDVWVKVGAGLCFASTFLLVMTFLIDTTRYQYPEKAVIFQALCLNFYSLAYLIRAWAGKTAVACERNSSGVDVLTQNGLENARCAIVFLLLFYFGHAAAVWWLLLQLSWLLHTMRWSLEKIESISGAFHLIGWVTPAILTIIVLVIRNVAADELVGVCQVSLEPSSPYLILVIMPNVAFVGLGLILWLVGLLFYARFGNSRKSSGRSVCCVGRDGAGSDDQSDVGPDHELSAGGRSSATHNGSQNSSSGRSPHPPRLRHANSYQQDATSIAIRIGVYSVIYLVPSLCVIGGQLYEFLNWEDWQRKGSQSGPRVEIFVLKLVMQFVIGLAAGFWIFFLKPLKSWRNSCKRICWTRRPKESMIPMPTMIHNQYYAPGANGSAAPYYYQSVPLSAAITNGAVVSTAGVQYSAGAGIGGGTCPQNSIVKFHPSSATCTYQTGTLSREPAIGSEIF